MACCDQPEPRRPIPLFWDFTAFTPTIPKLYWNVRSQEQRILNLFELLDKVICYAQSIGMEVDGYQKDLDTLKKEFEEFKDGALLDWYKEQLSAWIQEHMPDIIREAIRMVHFGLTSDGHFCAYIPDAWSDIVFDTGYVYGRSDFGRLILKMEVDSDSVIDNTYSYSLAQPTLTETYVRDLELNTRRTDAAYDTLYTNISKEVTQNGTEQ